MDIQGERIVVVRAERGRARVTCNVVRAEDRLFQGAAKQGVPVAAVLGPRESITQWLEVAFGARAKALKVLPTVLDIQLPFAVEQCAYGFTAVQRTTAGRTRALGVAARFADVERKLARLAQAGVDPVVLDHEGLALWTQSLEEMPGEAAEAGPAAKRGTGAVRVVAYRGVERETLVVGVAGEYRGAHAVRLEDAAQVRRLIRAAAGGDVQRVSWWWAGPGAEDQAACEAVIAGLRQDWGDGWAEGRNCMVAVHREPATFLARALATRLVTPGAWRCNLRTGAFEHPALARARAGSTTRALALALAAGLVLCAVNLAVSALVRERVGAYEAVLVELGQATAGRALGAARGAQAVLIAKRQVEAQRRATEPYRRYSEPRLTGLAGAIIEVAGKQAVTVESLVLKPERLSVSGCGPGWESAAPLVATLEARGFTATVDREAALADGTIPFSVTAEARHE